MTLPMLVRQRRLHHPVPAAPIPRRLSLIRWLIILGLGRRHWLVSVLRRLHRRPLKPILHRHTQMRLCQILMGTSGVILRRTVVPAVLPVVGFGLDVARLFRRRAGIAILLFAFNATAIRVLHGVAGALVQIFYARWHHVLEV